MTEETNVGGAPVNDSAPMTVADGESRILAILDGPSEQSAPEEKKKEESAPPAERDAPSEPSSEKETGEADAPSDPEGEPVEFEKLHGNTRVRLRDGSEITVGDLKKRWGELQELPRKSQELEAQQRQFQERHVQIAHHEQFMSQVLPLAIGIATRNLPPEPDPELASTDPLAHYELKVKRDAAVAELQSLHHASQKRMAELAQQSKKEDVEYVREQQRLIIRDLPELKDESKRRDFSNDVMKIGRDLGFSDKEIAELRDHRVFKLVKKAIAYDKLVAERPKAEAKAKDAPPVQLPGKRVTVTEQATRARDERLKRMRETGDRQLGEALIRDLL